LDILFDGYAVVMVCIAWPLSAVSQKSDWIESWTNRRLNQSNTVNLEKTGGYQDYPAVRLSSQSTQTNWFGIYQEFMAREFCNKRVSSDGYL
jgi:hypothetical protein